MKSIGAGNVWERYSDVDIYLSTDATITTVDLLLGERWNYDGLAARAKSSLNTTVTIPRLMEGTYYTGTIADFRNEVTYETDETNNSLAGTLSTIVVTP